MPKDVEFPMNTLLQSSPTSRPGASSSVATPTAANGSARIPTSSSSAKYRFDSSATSPSAPSSPKARSALQQVPTQSATALLATLKAKTGTQPRVSAANSSRSMLGAEVAATDTLETSSTGEVRPSSPKAKLPDKLRQHVSRLRSQFALVTSPSPVPFGGNNAKSGLKLPHRVSGLVGGLSPSSKQQVSGASPIAGVSSRALKASPMALASSTSGGLKYSSQSNKMQTLQTQLSKLKMSTRNVLKSSDSPLSSTAIQARNDEEDTLAAISPPKKDTSVHFFDLLRPLQNSLSCASLMSEWASDEDEEQQQVGQVDQLRDFYNCQQPEQLQLQQPERHRSRMLRICCSVDNLLLSIGSQVQEEKHDQAIARGAARQLLELFQFAINQVAAAISTSADGFDPSIHVDNNSSSITYRLPEEDKELQYMNEFVVEIADRMSRLDQFVRATFMSEISGLNDQIERDGLEMAELKLTNAQLQTEMNDLRDFHSQNSMSVLGFARNNSSSSSSFGVPPDVKGTDELTKEESNQERMASLFPTAAVAATSSTSSSECPHGVDDRLEQLHNQCDELARLLEMAKQEIRLCHREHDAQKSRIAELSNAMFRDQELTSVRSQLQSEKRRVKNLEIENFSLRENQIDQTMKIQSLLTNGALLTIASQVADAPSHQALERGGSSSSPEARLQRRGSVSASIGAPLVGAAPDSLSKPQDNGSGAGAFEAPGSLLYRQSSANSTSPSSPKRKENATLGDDSRANWFFRVLGLSQSLHEPTGSRKKQPESADDTSFAQQKQFLSGLLMSEKQVAVAQAQTKIRRQANVPTLAPPVLLVAADPKKKKKAVLNSSQGDGNSTEDLRAVVIVCRQLVWFFYQRFLMLEEANALQASLRLAANSTPQHKSSLASVVIQFFLERRAAGDDDESALMDAAGFVKCLHKVRAEAGDVHFFCEFLEGARSREELCFFLWVLQAIDDTKIGIAYEVPLANLSMVPGGVSPADELSGGLPHLCLFKATFLTRIIFRLFHVRALKRPTTAAAASRKPSSSTQAPIPTSPSKKDLVVNGSSPASSPRKKRKSRMGEDDTLPSAKPSAVTFCVASQPSQQQSLLLSHASECFHSAVVLNNGAPLTLETFNALVTQFAVVPGHEELRLRMGPFFRPSGDEKKIVIEVFLVLIMDMFAHQLAWRKKTMRELFITLAQRLEVEQVACQLKVKELAEAAALKGKRPSSAKSKPKSPAAAKKKPKKKKKRDHDRNSSSSRYLVGLTRAQLRQFLVQAGVVSDILTVDVDQLFVVILELAGRSAREIHFDELYGALARLDWLGNRDLQVDPTTTVLNQQWQSTDDEAKVQLLTRLRDRWAVDSRQSLALCENDPNVFVRRRAKLLTESISQSLALFPQKAPLNQQFWCSLQGIREFLGFSWRVATKRSGESQLSLGNNQAPHWFLSELVFLNHAIHVTSSDFPGYQHPRTLLLKADESSDAGDADTSPAVNDLRCFWDTSRLVIDDLLIKYGADKQVLNEPHLVKGDNLFVQELELVLKRFCVHLVHLFTSYASAAFNFVGLTLSDWLRMTRELRRVDKKLIDANDARELFFKVYSREIDSLPVRVHDECPPPHEVWISKSQFTELLIRIAFLKAEAREEKKHPALRYQGLLQPAQIVSDFCHHVVVPTAFQQRERLQEVDFVHKLSCPLVSRVLLEHRAFLRIVFFYYAKQDEEEDEHQREPEQQRQAEIQRPPQMYTLSTSNLHGFQLGKTERNSMNFDEFQTFLAAFELLEGAPVAQSTHLSLESARLVFRSVMALENADISQMEFEEFAAAVAALAVYRDPCPFRLWHDKIDAFVEQMQRVVAHKALRFD